MLRKGIILTLALIALTSWSGCVREKPRISDLAPGSGTLIVELEGFRNNRGDVILSLFRTERGFPEDMDRAVKNAYSAIVDYRANVVFGNLPYGVYALSILHDENRNGKMDTTLIGIPKEGHGASNDAQRQFAPPKFEDARFILNSEELRIQAKIHYFKRKKPWDDRSDRQVH